VTLTCCDSIAPNIANEGLVATASSKMFAAISKQRITRGEIVSRRQTARAPLCAAMVVMKRLLSVKTMKSMMWEELFILTLHKNSKEYVSSIG
jgi:hypothetical protein